MNADGTGATRITAHSPVGDDTSPAWSPDGKRIVFARFTSDGMNEIFTVSSSGGGERRLTHSRFTDFEPDWGLALSASRR
jgi:TolB protein